MVGEWNLPWCCAGVAHRVDTWFADDVGGEIMNQIDSSNDEERLCPVGATLRGSPNSRVTRGHLGQCSRSRVEGDKRTEGIELRSYFPGASVDQTNGTSLSVSPETV